MHGVGLSPTAVLDLVGVKAKCKIESGVLWSNLVISIHFQFIYNT